MTPSEGASRVGTAAAALALTMLATAAPATAATVPQPPLPPRVTTEAPSGASPGAAAGVHMPERCLPPEADDDGSAAGIGAARLQLAQVHRLATGRAQLIAVIDTGVSPHAQFGARLRGGGDYLTGGDGLDDCDGHGTAVAGLLAAAPEVTREGGRPSGLPIGIAPAAELLSIRQSSLSIRVSDGTGRSRPAGDVDTLAEAIVLAIRQQATVINISEAVCLSPDQAASAGRSLHAALRRAAEADVVVVAAAGNAGVAGCEESGPGQVSLPGWYDDELLTVAAADPNDEAAPFTVAGPWVDVAAPGTDLRSLAVGGGMRATGISGTSFAAPWVAGLAALVRERFPDLGAAQVTDRILATARRPAGGGNDALGYGVIDPVAALTAVPDVLSPAALPARGTGDPASDPPSAELPGTSPRIAQVPPAVPVDLLAAATLLTASVVAAFLLRRRPRRAG